MAIKKFGDYETTQSYKEYDPLPKGGYVIKILGAEVCESSYGQYIKLSCDIAEGEYSGFYSNDYKNQQSDNKKWHCNYLLNVPNDDGSERDDWTKRKFKTVIEAIEDSNNGYHFDWDEQKFKGKIVGGLFNEREYEDSNRNIRRTVNLAKICSVDKIRSGKFTLPGDKLIQSSAKKSMDGFMTLPDGAEEELPFTFD